MSVNLDCSLAAYDYHLPPEQIAQVPATPRDSARLLVVKNSTEHIHSSIRELPDLLRSGDLLVLNNTRVIPARLYGHKLSGLPVEVLLLEPQPDDSGVTTLASSRWLALVKPGRRLKPGATILFGSHPDLAAHSEPNPLQHEETVEGTNGSHGTGLKATILATDPATAGRILQFEVPLGKTLEQVLADLGQVPLPPYITGSQASPEQYQTVYAEQPGSAAAPTAGLHFTQELLNRLQEQGIEQAFVTLHVGVGTFRPVESEDITLHRMHAEWAEVSPQTVEKIRQTKARGGRVIAVGTTVVRSLESAAQSGTLQPFCNKTELFIYPGYEWKVIDGMMTNFHLPRSSLMMLVSALVGRQRLLDLYQIAIEEQYRFYSFGDAMLLLPESRV